MGAVFKYAALIVAVVMALPFGWCCPRPVAAAEQAASAPARCPNCQPADAPAQNQAPATPASPEKCPCCQAREKTNSDQASPVSMADAWMPPVVAAGCDAPADVHRSAAEFVRFSGPALQALYCVWRC